VGKVFTPVAPELDQKNCSGKTKRDLKALVKALEEFRIG
jgi:hypothetical protein